MGDSSSPLVPATRGSRALARVEVERGVRFVGEELSYFPAMLLGMGLYSLLNATLGSLLTATPFLLVLLSSMAPSILSARGRRRLERILDPRAGRPLDATVEALRELLRARWLPANVRCDAAGWLALGLIEHGELDQAVEALRESSPRSRRWRVRGSVSGFFGEAVRAIVRRLDPRTGWSIVSSDVLHPRPDEHKATPWLSLVRAALRLLEAIEAGDHGLVAIRWAELPRPLTVRAPVLTMLLRIEAARVVPELRAELDTHIRAMHPGVQRLLFERASALVDDGASSYRVLATIPWTGERALEPLGVQTPPTRWSATIFISAPAASATMLAIALQAWWFVGTTVGIWALGKLRIGRRRRIRGLVELGVPRSTWLRELGHMRSRSHHTRPSWTTALAPFEHGDTVLVLAVRRAERALLIGDRDAAHAAIAWWLDNASPRVIQELDPVALGAALLRLAALLGFDDAVRRLEALPSSTRRGMPRSGHGDAPRAMSMARAIVAARRHDWEAAAEHVQEALAQPKIDLDPIDYDLYYWLLDSLAERGHAIDRSPLGLRPARIFTTNPIARSLEGSPPLER
jgi:hypothetical protein